jgi:uncharacterized protein
MFFDPMWLLLMLFSTVIGLATQGYINSSFRKWSQVPLHTGRSGEQVARTILDMNGLQGVSIQPVAGELSDHYDPRNKTLGLSRGVHGVASVAAAGVAAHEAGHAIQDEKRYVWGTVRTALVPVVNIGSQASMWLIMAGFFLQFSGLIWLGVLFYAGAVLFQLVTLPVEFDASRRALASLSASGTMTPDQIPGARQVLTAAALTYVAGALIAALQLLYFIGLARR